MNKKYEKNLSKQKVIEEKIEDLQSELQDLKDEQEEMENIEILKSYRSTNISLDDFLKMMKNHKKEEMKEKKNEEDTKKQEKSNSNQYVGYTVDENTNKDTEETLNEKN